MRSLHVAALTAILLLTSNRPSLAEPAETSDSEAAPAGTCAYAWSGSECGSDGRLYACELGRATTGLDCAFGCIDNGWFGSDECGTMCSDKPTGYRYCFNERVLTTCAFGRIATEEPCEFRCWGGEGSHEPECASNNCTRESECDYLDTQCEVGRCNLSTEMCEVDRVCN